MRWINTRQSGILAERYFDTLLGDLRHTFLLLFQAPFIAGLILIVWRNIEKATETLYFVLVLTVIWFGCNNACREIVKEQGIFFRERMVGVEIPAYVLSKFVVLALFGFLQCLTLLVMVNYSIHLPADKLLLFLTLYVCSLAATTLGLLVSALTSSQAKAVGIIPLLILPQILFSELILPQQLHDDLAQYLERLMLAGWGYENFQELVAPQPAYLVILRNFGVLVLFGSFFLYATTVMLKHKTP